MACFVRGVDGWSTGVGSEDGSKRSKEYGVLCTGRSEVMTLPGDQNTKRPSKPSAIAIQALSTHPLWTAT